VIALLNAKQELFCMRYSETGDAIDSYTAAGYKVKNKNTASAAAQRLLKRPEIKARLAEIAEEMATQSIANAKEIQERLTRILRMEETEDVVVVEGCGDGCSDARIIKKRPALKDVINAGEKLARMQGAFDTKLQLEMTIPVFGGEDSLED
jgi:phage terminase small subunit